MKSKYDSAQSLSLGRDSTLYSLGSKVDIFKVPYNLPHLTFSIWKHIFLYLDSTSLARCEGVCQAFRHISSHYDLWMMHCIHENIDCGPGIEIIWERCNGDKGRWWKEIYVEGIIGRENWIRGKHKKRLLSLTDQSDAITCFKFDDDKIIIGTRQSNLQLFYTRTTEMWDKPALTPDLKFQEAHSSPILCLDFNHPSEYLLASGDASGTLALWNIYTGELISKKKKCHDKGMSCVVVLGSNMILTAGFDKTLRLFKRDSRSKMSSMSSHELPKEKKQSIFKKIFTTKHKKDEDKCAIKLLREYRGHKGEIYCMRLLGHEKLVATGATDNNIKIWDIYSGECLKTLQGHKEAVTCLAVRGDKLFSGSLDKIIRRKLY
ncbi:hypothetical protein HDV06_006276 [Boothiomyces sp. JEL0866]|nr:hypothetical protein HDV06_006733 [Boothiomyces sp. JEL0866]KAJ3319466.1 hypothetical protein HDV06_006276 [Boothiomyces sp. JEL0866]